MQVEFGVPQSIVFRPILSMNYSNDIFNISAKGCISGRLPRKGRVINLSTSHPLPIVLM